MKAVALFSGGLDSILAIKLIESQKIEVIPLHFYTWFTGRIDPDFPKECERCYGISPVVVDLQDEFYRVLMNPKYGYGQGFNPCIDCKILFFKKAGEFTKQEGARFVVSGEVVGQRPMSQRKDTLNLIERESGLEGLIVRPLCAKNLPLSIPEKEGWVDREKLEAIQGRGRKRQLELAKKFSLKKIPSPAGGCLLTDPTFASRIKSLLDVHPNPSLEEVKLLKKGRMFRINGCIFVVARNDTERKQFLKASSAWKEENGLAAGIPIGNTKGKEHTLAGILLRYAKKSHGAVFTPEGKSIKTKALPPEVVHTLLVEVNR